MQGCEGIDELWRYEDIVGSRIDQGNIKTGRESEVDQSKTRFSKLNRELGGRESEAVKALRNLQTKQGRRKGETRISRRRC